MKYFPSLKVEFRAVPYASSHVIEYRISPEQDVTYFQEVSFLWIFKFKVKRKFDTSWKQPQLFRCTLTSKYYPENDTVNYMPLFIYKKEDLDEYVRKYKTIGEWFEWMDKIEETEKAKYQNERAEYLEQSTTWYPKIKDK